RRRRVGPTRSTRATRRRTGPTSPRRTPSPRAACARASRSTSGWTANAATIRSAIRSAIRSTRTGPAGSRWRGRGRRWRPPTPWTRWTSASTVAPRAPRRPPCTPPRTRMRRSPWNRPSRACPSSTTPSWRMRLATTRRPRAPRPPPRGTSARTETCSTRACRGAGRSRRGAVPSRRPGGSIGIRRRVERGPGRTAAGTPDPGRGAEPGRARLLGAAAAGDAGDLAVEVHPVGLGAEGDQLERLLDEGAQQAAVDLEHGAPVVGADLDLDDVVALDRARAHPHVAFARRALEPV